MKIISLIITKYKHELILVFFILVYVFYFTTASFFRYDNFYTGRFDLGNMDQTVWNTINGRIFQASSDLIPLSRLSAHADFMLILLSPFYLLWSHPKMLLLIQTVVLSFGAIFVFLIGKEILKNKNLALIFSILYLMNPLLQLTNLYDFHAVTLSTTFLLASFYFLIKKKYFLLVIFLLLSGITKEQVWIIVSIFGIPLLFKKDMKLKILGAGIMLFSLFIFGLLGYLIWYAIPQSLGREHFAVSYYSDFGDSPLQVIKTIIFSPQKILSTVFKEDRLEYLKQLFIPLGFISFLNPLALVFSIPDLFINLLSKNPQLHQIYYQYTANITPFIFISAIYGVKIFIKWFPKIPKFFISFYLIIFTLLSSFLFGPLPGGKNSNLDMFTKPQPKKQIIENFISRIPQKHSVAATNNLGSHASQRRDIYTIPEGIDSADVILFLLNDQFAQPSLQAQKEMVENLKQDKSYIKVFEKDDFVVFKKREIML
ncbi:MAG: DUF2079 domain-containing protein [Candidatus Levybacteria bacterium]|nr:DUF2079 domain-containing protein [Candidatus Levybacteria bacterium]